MALLVGGTGAFGYASQLPAVASGSFSGAARADGLVLEVVNPSLPAIPEGRVEVTLSTSQAILDSIGQSRAFASAPYVEAAATLPETVNGLLAGAAPPLPSYPFIVFSDYPTDVQEVRQAGPYTIEARSNETASTAHTTAGAVTTEPKVFTTESFAEVRNDAASDTQTATARTQTAGISVGGVMDIGNVVSSAVVRQRGSSAPEIDSSFKATAVSVLGVPLSIDDSGIRIGTGIVPMPDLGALNTTLDSLGMRLRFLPSQRTSTGVSSAGLELTYATSVPSQGRVTVKVVLGRISASIGRADVSSTTPAPAVVDTSVPAVAGVESVPSLDLPQVLPDVPVTPTTSRSVAPSRPTAVASVIPTSQWAERFYLIVAVAALASLVGGRAVGLLGVRTGPRALPAKLTQPAPTLRLPRS